MGWGRVRICKYWLPHQHPRAAHTLQSDQQIYPTVVREGNNEDIIKVSRISLPFPSNQGKMGKPKHPKHKKNIPYPLPSSRKSLLAR